MGLGFHQEGKVNVSECYQISNILERGTFYINFLVNLRQGEDEQEKWWKYESLDFG
jgi:hypothetical protein